MYKIIDIIKTIEEFAPVNLQEAYDNSGLVCGDYKNTSPSVLIAIDITEEVIDDAIKGGEKLIISHHPLIFKGIKNIIPDNYINRVIIKAIKHDIAIYSAHTNIDSVMDGVSGRMADKLGLRNRRFLEKRENIDSGFGIIGELSEYTNTYNFLKNIKDIFKCGIIKHSPIINNKIRTVALCGGSGAFLIKEAIKQKADIYISGDFKYHDFFMAENNIILADIGHYESEMYTKEIFYELITKKIPKFAVRFSSVNTNPVNYL